MVIVNGIKKNIRYRRCKRCICDNTMPGIRFDSSGICNFCHLHDKWTALYPNDNRGKRILDRICKTIRQRGRNSKYDCVVGISGGRDSSYALHVMAGEYRLRTLAVHFNDGFDNPVAGENIRKITSALNVPLITITSDWREARDLKIAFMKASVPEMNQGTDIGIAAACYSAAMKENVKSVIFGQSFRIEGIKPLSWAFMTGEYLKSVHRQFGSVPLKKWEPDNAGYMFGWKEVFYYTIMKGIRLYAPLYYLPYDLEDTTRLLNNRYDWTYPGAKYYDDLFWALNFYVQRVKFNINFHLNFYSAQVRDGQLSRDEAIEKAAEKYLEDEEKIMDLCLKRLDISREQFDKWMALPPKSFRDYYTGYEIARMLRPLIWAVTQMKLMPETVYDKYFLCGE